MATWRNIVRRMFVHGPAKFAWVAEFFKTQCAFGGAPNGENRMQPNIQMDVHHVASAKVRKKKAKKRTPCHEVE